MSVFARRTPRLFTALSSVATIALMLYTIGAPQDCH